MIDHKYRNKSYKKMWTRFFVLFFVSAIIFSSIGFFTPAYAYDEVNDLSFTVGYWAGNKEYTKKKVSLSELASSCGTHREVYTWIANGSTLGSTEAEGIYLSDILEYAGIDRHSVFYYNFFTSDGSSYQGAAKQWQESQLFASRYSCADSLKKIVKDYNKDPSDFMENPERHYTLEKVFDYESKQFSSEAWDDRREVQPMLALRTKPAKWSGYAPASYLDFSGLGTSGKPVLIFGQAAPNEITRNLHAQMVNKVHIWFEGSPSITLKATDLKGKVGSKKKVTVQVDTPDDFLTQQIAKDVVLSSSNTKAAKVSSEGTVTFTGKGTAEIKATYDGKTYGTLTATGEGGSGSEDSDDPDDQGNDPDDGDKPDNGDGNGTGTTSGDGDGSGSGKNNGEGASTGEGDSNASGSGRGKISIDGTGTAKMQGSAGGAASGSGEDARKVFEISAADKELKESVAGSKLFKWIIIVAGIAVLCGITGQSVYYRSQIKWTERAKRTYEQL